MLRDRDSGWGNTLGIQEFFFQLFCRPRNVLESALGSSVPTLRLEPRSFVLIQVRLFACNFESPGEMQKRGDVTSDPEG